MVNTHLLCYSIFEEDLVRKINFRTVNLDPRTLSLADCKVLTLIKKLASGYLNIKGWCKKIWVYVLS